MANSGKGYRMFGGVGVELIAYDVLSLLSIVSILVALSKTRLKRVLEEDALSRRLVTMCGLSLVYEYKFRLGQQISHFRFMREYAYTLVSISQFAHFVALIAAALDAICWRVSSRRRAQLCMRPKAARIASWMAWTVVTFSSIAVVAYVQLYRGEKTKIFFPKQVAELASIPLTLLFFVVTLFWRPATATAADKAECRPDPATEAISYVYIRMMVVTFAINCSRIILIMVKTEWKFIRFIHALDGCFFALIAYKLEPPDVDADLLGETFIDQLRPVKSDSTAAALQQV